MPTEVAIDKHSPDDDASWHAEQLLLQLLLLLPMPRSNAMAYNEW